jgi:hypothetical protein
VINFELRLADLGQTLLVAMVCIDKKARGMPVDEHKFYRAIATVLSTLTEWGLDSPARFATHVDVPLIFWQFLQLRDGEEYWKKPQNATIAKVYEAVREEYENIVRIAAQHRDADLERAKRFFLHLHHHQLIERYADSRGLHLAA